MNKLGRLLVQISQKPEMFVGTNSLAAVSHYISGYAHALEDGESLKGWRQWVELRFGICHPAWHWTRILLHSYGSDSVALQAFPQLYAEFSQERQQNGLECVMQKWEAKFSGLESITEPTSTWTAPF